jgi:NADPH2:quinone reductase
MPARASFRLASQFKLPAAIDDETAAAALLKAATVEMLVERCAKVEAGWPVLVHAAAGGVGLILVQWLKAIGATVIGTVSTEAKEQAARTPAPTMSSATGRRRRRRACPRDHRRSGRARDVRRDRHDHSNLAQGHGAPGLIVSYGNAGGPVSGVNLGVLAQHGSQFVTRPTLFDYYLAPAERAAGPSDCSP